MNHRNATDAPALSQPASDRAYSRWAPVYDLIFDLPFRPGRQAVAEAARRVAPEGDLLVAGVGTGLELPMLPPRARIVGVDVSLPMLRIARERTARMGLAQVQGLLQMDAGALDLADGSFDAALAPFVMSVVPDPAKVMNELVRVVRPGGEIVLLNHFASEGGPFAVIERGIEPAADWLGWRPRFPFAAIGDWIAAEPRVELIERKSIAPLGLFTLLRLRRKG